MPSEMIVIDGRRYRKRDAAKLGLLAVREPEHKAIQSPRPTAAAKAEKEQKAAAKAEKEQKAAAKAEKEQKAAAKAEKEQKAAAKAEKEPDSGSA